MSEQSKTDILEEFKSACSKASYHYADDTCDEWDLAEKYARIACEIANEYPEYTDDFKLILDDELVSYRDIFG